MPPEDPGEPELPLGGELGTGRLGVLGWVITLGVRQPASITAAQAAIAVRNWLWPTMLAPPTPPNAGPRPA